MTITLQALINADTWQLRAAAARWDALAKGIDSTADHLITTTRDLPHYWSGPDGQAAQARSVTLQNQVGNTQLNCQAIADAIRTFAGDLEGYQVTVHQLAAEAEAQGLSVDLRAGTITAPLTLQADPDSYLRQFGEVVDQANAADLQVRDLIRAQEPASSLPSAQPQQIDLSSAPDWSADSPQYRATQWHRLTATSQDALVQAYPGLIGSLPGVPSSARDQANRLLLERDRSDLQALVSSDHAFGPAQANGLARLAAIDALEKQAAGKRLMTYDPGDPGQSAIASGDLQWDK